MRESEKVLKYLAANKKRILREYHLTKIGVFGSVARKEDHTDSDIDLIVEFDEGTPDLYSLKQRLKSELNKQFNRSVDICRKKYIKPAIKQHILSEAVYV